MTLSASWPGILLKIAMLFAGIALFATYLAAPARSAAQSDYRQSDYRLSVGDVVSFDFLDDALPAEELTVASDGQVNIPLIGGFEVAGLTVPEAMGAIRRTFIERELLIDPQISLGVVSFRPIYVLGDVKSPGSYPFQPMLNVEQAVALAGGQSAGGATAEDRVVTQARLRGDLAETLVRISREAIAAARLKAQLDGRLQINEDDIPADARGFVSDSLLESFMPTEQKILEVEQRGYETRHGQLTAAVEEVNGALENLDQLVDHQKAAIASAREDLERNRALYKRGIKTLTDITNRERDVAAQESHLLEIYNQMSATRRELGELQRQLSDATDTRTRGALMELQRHFAEIERLLSTRRSKEEQILLLSSLSAEEARQDSTIAFTYQVRSKIDGKTVTRSVGLLDEVAPGDTVLVSIDTAGTPRSAALTKTALGPAR